jgi:single-strand DNA-binding protein
MNKVILVGRVGKDPETRFTNSGTAVCTISVATDESYVKDGQKVEKTEWHTVVAWDKLAEIITKFVEKGAMVTVEGKLQTRSWEDKETGQTRYKTEIVADQVVLLGGKSGGSSDAEPSETPARPKPITVDRKPAYAPPAPRAPARNVPQSIDSDDDIPF